MIIVDTKSELNVLLGKVVGESFVMDVVPLDDEIHPSKGYPSIIFLKFFIDNSLWCIPIYHNEAIPIHGVMELLKESLNISVSKKFVLDKKSSVQFLGRDFNFLDINLIKYLNDGEPVDFDEFSTNSHIFIKTRFRQIKNSNRCIPIYKHAKVFEQKVSLFQFPDDSSLLETGFTFTNDIMIDCFAKLENVGLAVDKELFIRSFGEDKKNLIHDGLVFSQYNLFTSTGRPSNRFGGINYAALNKTDGSRESFISRFGKDGILVMMDYNAFHPRLIAHLVNFHIPGNMNPYEYMAQNYFNKTNVDEEDIAVSKALTFQQMYGGIDPRWIHIPYFSKIQDYINHRWKFFQSNGYVETPKFFRRIKPCHIKNASENKIFNYILQAFETEMAVEVLNKLQEHLSLKLSKAILYTYDSVLFDVHKDDSIKTLREIREIMEAHRLPVKIYAGKSYSKMEKIELD